MGVVGTWADRASPENAAPGFVLGDRAAEPESSNGLVRFGERRGVLRGLGGGPGQAHSAWLY